MDQRIRPSGRDMAADYDEPAFPALDHAATTSRARPPRGKLSSLLPILSTSASASPAQPAAAPADSSASRPAKPKSRFALQREREAAQRFTLDLDGDTANPKPQDDLPKLVGDVIERESGVAAPPTPVELVLRPFGATGFPSTQRLPTPSPALQPHSSTSHSHGSASSTLGEIPTLLASISAENDGVLASMSDAEIAAEQREVRESLSISEEILKMLETRGRKKAAERETAQVPPAARRRPDVAGVPPRPRVSAVEEEEEGSPEYIRKHFFPDEPRNANLDWMRPQVPREASAGDVAAWTFDLHGALIESSSSTPPQNTPSADHHVSSSSSFTLASLASLATSAVPSQRSTALLVLHRVLSTKSHASELGEKAWVSLRVETAVTAGRAIRDSNVGVASQAISLLAFLLATEPPQKAQLLQPQLEGAEGPPSVLASFLSTNPYPTLALHLSHASLEESSLASILSLLTSVLTLSTSSPSPDLAALLSTPNLLEALSKRFVALPWPPSPSSPTPLPSALAFFTLLSRSSRKAAQHLWNHKLVEPSLRFVAVLPWELDDESAPLVPLSRQLVCETLALWESMARYGLGTTLRTQGADLVDAVLRGSEGDAQIREALLRVLAVWTTAAVDPHITGHDIVWTQVQRWGEVAVEAHRSLVEDRGASRLLASAWWLLAEWLGGAKVNKSWRGEEERKWVGNKVGGDFSEGGRANVAVSDALRRLTQVGGDRDQVDGDADLVLSALRLSEAYEEPTTPPTPALLILDPPLVESAFAALVASRRPSSFVRRLLIYVLPTFTSLSTRLSHTLEVLVLLRPGDEVAARDLSTWVLSLAADVANHSLPALAALNPSLELVSLAKTAAIRPFITYAIVTSAGGRVVGPLYPTPRDLKLTAAQAPFAGDAPLLEADWPLVAFNELLRSATSPVFQQLPSGWDGSELELVRTSLALARVVQSSSATSAKPLAAQIVYDLIKVFMLEKDNLTSATPGAESDLFRDERVQYSMTALLAPLAVAGRPRQVVRPDARSSTCTLEGVSSLVSSAPFYQLYTDLIGLFDSISLSHPVFSQVVLPPLAMSYPVDYRKLLWIDYAHLLPTIHIDVGAAVTDHDVGPEGDGALASFLYPTESDASILAAYGDALVSGKVTRASTPFLYLVAVHHVAMTVFATSASSPGESIGRKLAGGISAKGSEELVGDVLAYKQGGAVGDMLGLPPLCYEGGERAERKARLELLGGPRVASA